MKTLASAGVFVVFVTVAGVVGLLGWLGWEIGNRALDALDAIGPMLFELGAVVSFGVGVFVAVGGAVALVRWMALRSRAVNPGQTGLYPAMYHDRGYISLNDQHAQALAVMHSAGRATSASVGRVLDWQPEPAPVAIGPAAALTPAAVVDVDPRTSPHWLLVGSSGSGKTVASFRILAELARRNPCQMVICEPGGVNWAGQATATNTLDIARAIGGVHHELERRQGLLRAADVDHVRDLAQPLPYVVLLAEETESLLDDLRLQDRELRTATIIALRSIARLGRKCGICLVAVTQAGSLDVFDAHVRKNVSNVLLFRSEHTVSETWRLGGVRLADLPPGTAYSVRHSAVVQFSLATRPALPLLPSPGIPVDWPVPDTAIPVQTPVDVPDGAIPAFGTDDRTAYSDAQIAHIQALYGRLGSIKAVERALYGQDGGYWFYRLQEVLG